LSETECVQARFREFYIASRERHDDFADQIDAAGIGATRHHATQVAHFSGRHFIFYDLST
jgi:hypothetical protein